jgi:hypothetical protein
LLWCWLGVQGSGSYVNKAEVEFVLMLYRNLVARFPDLKQGPKVAVISPSVVSSRLLLTTKPRMVLAAPSILN